MPQLLDLITLQSSIFGGTGIVQSNTKLAAMPLIDLIINDDMLYQFHMSNFIAQCGANIPGSETEDEKQV